MLQLFFNQRIIVNISLLYNCKILFSEAKTKLNYRGFIASIIIYTVHLIFFYKIFETF